MASEYRFVMFSWRDVREGLVVYDRKRGVPTPTVPPSEFDVDTDTLQVTLTFGKDERRKRFVYDKGSVVAAMIMRCKDKGVRLPLKSRKDMHLLEGRLAMSIHIAGPAEPDMLAFEILSQVAA
ncbi:MAG: hypothetical protein NBV67_05040 [Tagaea sp.]|nr:hypothetical protein [Tagaea sp.]